ncbi:hypothetical protein PQD13_gp78 [Gordonia phage Clawz]|uniref:Uncharacterized protein n=1 Tax=Gordonia phage Clawz TaxID=2743910 RepID=A0AAE7K6X8_9CAUD|nr:hypothetical protein PQD13_gp78 [Gordonia phage Clawz]QKY79990.1 hypothetical protein SEA_CLAWZ_78 [Gordonia phage Clawz]
MKYTLFWLTGDAEIVDGPTPEDAMNRAGIGAGALPALDFWAQGDRMDDYEWSREDREWRSK